MHVPVTILTGFLGAGKTTLLNHLLHANHGLRVAVLVNDFGDINIDSQLIVGVEEGAITLSNGCICCTIRDDLRQSTLQLFRRPEPPEYVVIEASGVSDPLAVAHTFTETDLSHFVTVDGILTVVDAEQFGALPPENAMLAIDQIGMADIVVLNKVDLVTGEALASVKEEIWRIVPQARILETSYGQAPAALLLGVGKYDPARILARELRDVQVEDAPRGAEQGRGEHVYDHSLIFHTWSYREKRPFAFNPIRQAIENLPNSIYRVKGVLYLNESPDRRCILQVVGKRARITINEPWGEEEPNSQLVLIGAPQGVKPAQLQATFEACLAEKTPSPSPLRAVIEWVRNAWDPAAVR